MGFGATELRMFLHSDVDSFPVRKLSRLPTHFWVEIAIMGTVLIDPPPLTSSKHKSTTQALNSRPDSLPA